MSDLIQAWISRSRISELKGYGWRIIGPIDETCVLMEGPEIVGRGFEHISVAAGRALLPPLAEGGRQ